MREIEINGRTFQYETFSSESEWGSSEWTEFYEGTEIVKRKKWGLFGPTIIKTVPKHVFTIYEDANNPKLTKKWWWKRITKEIELLDRAKEVEDGHLTFSKMPKPDRSIYDKTRCPFPDSQVEWEDFCDWINREGEYKNVKEDELSFPKSFFLISANK